MSGEKKTEEDDIDIYEEMIIIENSFNITRGRPYIKKFTPYFHHHDFKTNFYLANLNTTEEATERCVILNTDLMNIKEEVRERNLIVIRLNEILEECRKNNQQPDQRIIDYDKSYAFFRFFTEMKLNCLFSELTVIKDAFPDCSFPKT